MRVLHVIPSVGPRLGGPSVGTLGMCAALANRGMDITVLTTDLINRGGWIPLRRPANVARRPNSDVLSGRPLVRSFPTVWPARLAFSPLLGQALKQAVPSFDVVHIHCLYLYPGIIAAHYARKYGVPYVLQPHGSLNPYIFARHRWRKAVVETCFERKSIRRAGAMHYASAQEAIEAKLAKEQSMRFVVPLGVDLDEFGHLPPRGSFTKRYPELQGKSLVVFIGRITRKKGLDLLIHAFRRVASEFPDARLVIAGPDDEGYGATVRALISNLGLTRLVTMIGMVEGRERLALFADSDVWTLPSYDENFGIAVAEALASGLPVVISDRVNIHRLVSSSHAGIVVRCDDRELADSISSLLGDPGRRAQLGAAARALALSSFSWDAVAVKLERIYRHLAAPPGTYSDLLGDLQPAQGLG